MRMIGVGLFLAGVLSVVLAPVVVGVRIVLLLAMSILLILLGDKGRKIWSSWRKEDIRCSSRE